MALKIVVFNRDCAFFEVDKINQTSELEKHLNGFKCQKIKNKHWCYFRENIYFNYLAQNFKPFSK